MVDKRNSVIAALLIAVVALAAHQYFGPQALKSMPMPMPTTDPAALAALHIPAPGKDGKGGGMTPYESNQVRNTIAKNNHKIKDCYDKFVETAPKVTDGKVVVDWQIASNGDVIKAEIVSSEIGSDALHSCVTTSIKGWSFPPTLVEANIYTSFTFVFKADKTAMKPKVER